ncbi:MULTISPECIES: FtsX-like permease family protein [unclassified Micromonospora]|uniref:FtsX-like permease family protein n=1 Tax=unclassified Micromonospora TaxID=2617518 RepID=UPI003A862C7E
MSLFSLARLVTAGDRGSWGRLLGMAGGVAVGVLLLLLLWGAYNGLATRTERSTWTTLIYGVTEQVNDPAAEPLTDSRVFASTVSDYFAGRTISRVDIASTPSSTVVVPGIGRPPAIGTYYASPALIALIDAHPADQLGARYGTRAGVIADTALASPDSLVVVVGLAAGDLDPGRAASYSSDATIGVWAVERFGGSAFPSIGYRTVAIIGAIAILLPVLVLVGIVTRLGAAARAERFAALRLIGATPRRVADIAAAEIGATSLVGAIAGAILAWLLIPVAAQMRVGDGRFFHADLTVAPVTVIVVVAGVVAVSTAVAWWRTASAGIGPLGVTREQSERRPSVLGVLPLFAGIVTMLSATVAALMHSPLPATDIILIMGFILISIGLITSGPVLTFWVARLGASAARSPAGVIAMNRIRQHPRATFRAVSGLVAAVFMVSVFSAAITAVAAESAPGDGPGLLPLTTVVARLGGPPDSAKSSTAAASQVAQVTGVTGAVVAYYHPDEGIIVTASDAAALGLPVPEGARYVHVHSDYLNGGTPQVAPGTSPGTAPAALLVATDGTTSTIERARTAILLSGVKLSLPPSTRSEQASSTLQTWANRYASLANLGILVATLISAVSLAVSTIAAILDRKRVLGLLRLMGMPVSTVRRIVLAEAALPLATVFALCIGLGFLVAWSILAGLTEGNRTISWPEASYYHALAASLLLAAAAAVGTFRTARKKTGLTVTRFE